MMRALFSGVSGLKAHQTRMDVIGNNIANVNTTGYKSKSMAFSDILYQTTQAATGSNVGVGKAGTNPRQIGLGVKTGAINTSITTPGASQSTGNPFDLKIKGDTFFVVNDGTNTYFTKDGSFNVDNAGYLCMANTGYMVMGWLEDPQNPGTIVQSSVRPINIMGEEYATFDAAATTKASIYGIIDRNDDNLETPSGRQINVPIYDSRGYEYNLKFGIKPVPDNGVTTRSVVTKEESYALSGIPLYEVTGSGKTHTITYGNGGTTTDLTDISSPKALLDEINKLADANRGNPPAANVPVTIQISAPDPNTNQVTITLTANGQTSTLTADAGNLSKMNGATVTVAYDGDILYSKVQGNNDPENLVKVSKETLDALGATNNNGVITIPDVLITTKSFKDDSGKDQTEYEIETVDAAGAKKPITNIPYSALSGLLGVVDAKYEGTHTITEEVAKGGNVDCQFTLELLGMTDTGSGETIDIARLGDTSLDLRYNTKDGSFSYVGAEGQNSFDLNLSALGEYFENITVDMSNSSNVENGGKSTIEGEKDDGRKVGTRTGVSIGTDGTVTINYSNGQMRDIAQIAVARFDNPMGLQNEGDNCYSTTANSGGFNGIGEDISANGDYMTSGVLEMSNVDLSQEFTDMITTQRGFQANSRIITVSDTMLEELTNLKR